MDTPSLRSAILAIAIAISCAGVFGPQLVLRTSLTLLVVVCAWCRELFSAVRLVVEDHVARRAPDVCANCCQSHVGRNKL